MPVAEIVSSGNGVPFLVSAGIVYEIIAAACSSPQTTEINVAKRADTLMKWVYIGEAQAVVFVAIAAAVDKKQSKAIIAGGLLAGIIIHLSYVHAKQSGLASTAEGTEEY